MDYQQPPSNIIELYPDKFEVQSITDCWLFTGALNRNGYGHIQHKSKLVGVHRLSAHLSLGLDLDNGNIQACHYCLYRHCANPKHLYLGTASDNQQHSVLWKTHVGTNKTHCKHGHPFSGDNLYMHEGRRRCKTCRKLSTQKNDEKKRQRKLTT